MKVLHVLDHSLPLHSGYSFRSHSILRAQRSLGIDVIAVTSPKHGLFSSSDSSPRAEIDEVAYYRTSARSSAIPFVGERRILRATERALEDLIPEFRPDVLHAHSPVLNALPALRCGKRHGLPVVYEIRAFWEDAAVDHGSYGPRSWKYRLVRGLETRACRRATAVTTICEGLRQDLVARGIPASKVHLAPNSVDPSRFASAGDPTELRRRWNLEGKRVLGFLGSFYRYEGLDFLVDVFAKLAERSGDLALLLVGGGEMEAELRAKIAAMKLESRVILPGRVPQEETPDVYALVDFLVYPRIPIRLNMLVTPLKPLEAMAMGKPVIASDVGGHRELIRDRETGFLFRAGDMESAAHVIEKALGASSAQILQVVENAKRWVLQERSWERLASAYQVLYSSLLSEKRED